MILSLLIENFRSIKGEVKLNLGVNNPKNHMPSHVFFPVEGGHGALRAMGVYGANASGKSNVLLAFQALKYLVASSGSLKDGDRIPCYDSYRLSNQTKKSPTRFEVEFLLKGIKYHYKVSFDAYAVISESLDFYPSKIKANVFTREKDDTWETIKFGGHYKGGTKKIAFFKNNTYISKAGDNASTPELIRDVFNFFYKTLIHMGTFERLSLARSKKRDEIIKSVADVMKLIDTGIDDISASEIDFEPAMPLPDDFPSELKEILLAEGRVQYNFSHGNEDGGFEIFSDSDESDGTQKLFALLPLVLPAFKRQRVIVIDELDNNLHPHLADLIVKLFNDSTINIYGSQLIFSTHNIQLMSSDKLRRDQISFVEKNSGNSVLYSLDDFDKSLVKNNTPFGTWYSDGRFGGVPQLSYNKIKNVLRPNEKAEVSEAHFISLFGGDDE